MELQRMRALRGPNRWSRAPVLEAWVALEQERSGGRWPGLAARLAECLGAPVSPEDDLGTVLARLAAELQRRANTPVRPALAFPAETGSRLIVVGYEYEVLGRASVETALRLCEAALRGEPFDLTAEVRRLREIEYDIRPGGATTVLRAARERGIPVERLEEDDGCHYYRLGHGAAQRRYAKAKSDRTGAIAQALAQDKELTRRLLRQGGIPVPEGWPVQDAEDAWQAAVALGPPVVVKPRDSECGRGVTLHLRTREQVLAAYDAARAVSPDVLVERQISGDHYRLLVVGGRLVAAARRDPALVEGDGIHIVAELVARENAHPRRSETGPLWPVPLDDIGLAVLAEQGLTPESVPPAGARVLLRRNSNLAQGGTVVDVTDSVHPEVAVEAVEAAELVGLDIAGLDVVAADLSRPLEDQGAAVIEVNENPWLTQHVAPLCESPQPVGEAVVDLMFPPGQTGRIPVVAVSDGGGEPGASATGEGTAIARVVARTLRRAGRRVGLASADGVFIAGRRLGAWDGSGPEGARTVLRSPAVDTAVLEVAPDAVLDRGLGFDRCNVAVVAGVSDGRAENPAAAERVLVESAAPTGAVVLNADAPGTAGLADRCPTRVIWFARSGSHPVLVAHRARGGQAAFVRDGAVVLAEGDREQSLFASPDAERRGAALAAAAAVWALELSAGAIREAMTGPPDGARPRGADSRDALPA